MRLYSVSAGHATCGPSSRTADDARYKHTTKNAVQLEIAPTNGKCAALNRQPTTTTRHARLVVITHDVLHTKLCVLTMFAACHQIKQHKTLFRTAPEFGLLHASCVPAPRLQADTKIMTLRTWRNDRNICVQGLSPKNSKTACRNSATSRSSHRQNDVSEHDPCFDDVSQTSNNCISPVYTSTELADDAVILKHIERSHTCMSAAKECVDTGKTPPATFNHGMGQHDSWCRR